MDIQNKIKLLLLAGLVIFIVYGTSAVLSDGIYQYDSTFQDGGVADVTINNREIEAEVNVNHKATGLSGREKIGENQGMLFIYSSANKPNFWMRGMLFPIDIIWINGKKIVDISKNVPIPRDNETTPAYSPRDDADKVLEVNAGWVDRNNVEVGNKIKIEYR